MASLTFIVCLCLVAVYSEAGTPCAPWPDRRNHNPVTMTLMGTYYSLECDLQNKSLYKLEECGQGQIVSNCICVTADTNKFLNSTHDDKYCGCVSDWGQVPKTWDYCMTSPSNIWRPRVHHFRH